MDLLAAHRRHEPARGIPLLGGLFAVIDALFIFSGSRQTLHDRIADTIVIDLRRHVLLDVDSVVEALG